MLRLHLASHRIIVNDITIPANLTDVQSLLNSTPTSSVLLRLGQRGVQLPLDRVIPYTIISPTPDGPRASTLYLRRRT